VRDSASLSSSLRLRRRSRAESPGLRGDMLQTLCTCVVCERARGGEKSPRCGVISEMHDEASRQRLYRRAVVAAYEA